MGNKKNIFLFSIFFLIGLLVVFSIQVFRVVGRNTSFFSKRIAVTLMPPVNAYTAKIIALKGEVKKQGRDADDFSPVASGAAVVQGESIATANGNTTLEFENIANVMISQNSGIAFIDGIPAEFLFLQKNGKVTYEVLDDTKSLSVRSLHMLLQVSGKATVTTDADRKTILVEMLFGNGKIGINDTDTNTHVFQLAQGQKAIIDDETRKVNVE